MVGWLVGWKQKSLRLRACIHVFHSQNSKMFQHATTLNSNRATVLSFKRAVPLILKYRFFRHMIESNIRRRLRGHATLRVACGLAGFLHYVFGRQQRFGGRGTAFIERFIDGRSEMLYRRELNRISFAN